MGHLSERLRQLGAAVAEHSDRTAEDGATEALSRARNAFVSGAPAPARRQSPWVPALAAAACVALAGAGWALHGAGGPAPISYSVGAAAVPGVVGDWVAAGTAVPLETRFSDGSELDLSPGARMRVTTTNPAGADVLVERGSVHAAVAHPHGAGTARWALRAGPFEVRVTGTTFDAAWDPIAETFVLTMIEGRVVVSGPGIPPDRTVVGGERLVVSVRDARMALVTMGGPQRSPQTPPVATGDVVTMGGPQSSPQDPPVVTGDVVTMGGPRSSPQTPPIVTGDVVTMGGPRSSPQTPPGAIGPGAMHPAATAQESVAAAPAMPGWKELVARGKYRDAFAAAEASGFGAELERAPAGDLLMLADAARFSGSPVHARDALHAARRRFGVHGQTAFLLGKIAADQQGSPGEAMGWFETYLREEPGGALAEQALGRIVDLARRGGPEGARRAAERYLARYPDGSYAPLARSLTARGLPADRPGAVGPNVP